MRRRLGWMALVAVLAVPAALAWAGEDKGDAPALREGAACCCCDHESCPKK